MDALRSVRVVEKPRVRPRSAKSRRGTFCLRCGAPLPDDRTKRRLYCNLNCGKMYNTKGAVR
jgi:hypothetical protein